MPITMQGPWTITVKSKSAAFPQRFVVAGTTAGNGAHPGTVSAPPVHVTGAQWTIQSWCPRRPCSRTPGPRGLTVVGPATGRRYRFDGEGPWSMSTVWDAPSLAAVALDRIEVDRAPPRDRIVAGLQDDLAGDTHSQVPHFRALDRNSDSRIPTPSTPPLLVADGPLSATPNRSGPTRRARFPCLAPVPA